MIRFILVLLLTSTLNLGFAQSTPPAELLPTAVDSIRINVLLNRGKEMLLPNESEIHELLGTAKLESKEAQKFIKRLSKKSAYKYGRALLTHHNLVFICYSAEKVVLTVEISTLTRNIDLYKKDSDKEFYGKISKKTGNYLVKLLVKLNLYEPLQEIGDTEGID